MNENDPENLDLGEEVGKISSVPQWIQWAIVLGSGLVWAVLWRAQVVSVIGVAVGWGSSLIGLFIVAFRITKFRVQMCVYEDGIALHQEGQTFVIPYSEIESITAKFVHQSMNHTYVGSTAVLKFSQAGRMTPHKFECDFRQESEKERLINHALERCSESIQPKLLQKIKTDGELAWGDHVLLTPRGLQLLDLGEPNGVFVEYAEIAELQRMDNELKIFRSNDALPLVRVSYEAPNFPPIMDLLTQLVRSSRQQPVAAY